MQFTGKATTDDGLARGDRRGNLSAADKRKLDSLATVTSVATPLTLVSGVLDIQAATAALEGSMSAADKAKLDGLGTVSSNSRATNVAVGALSVTSLFTLALPATGRWSVVGYSLMQNASGGNGSVDLWLSAISPLIISTAFVITGTAYTVLTAPLVFGGGVTVTLNAYSNVAMTSLGTGGVNGAGGMTGIIATRIG